LKDKINAIWIDLNEELYLFILKKIKNEETAKDLHHEVFIKVQSKIHQLKYSSKLTSWVYQITRNTIIDYYRNLNRNEFTNIDFDIPEKDHENFEYSKLTNCINQKIETLSTEHKEAILLTSFKNYSQKELAKHLKLSYSGTKSRVQKAKSILKKNILDCKNIETDTTGKIIDFDNN
jgi:RNA polymerase sigma-70 factor (ECF subfamily)